MNLAEKYSPTRELAHAYSIHAPVMSLLPRFSRGFAYAQKSFSIYQSLGDLWGQGQALDFHGVALYAGSQFTECIEKCRESIRLLERAGDLWEVNVARLHTALSLFRLGNLKASAEESKNIHLSGIELGDIQASGFSLDCWAQSTGGKVPANDLQQELKRPRADVQVTAQVMVAEGVRLFYLGRVEEAAVVFEQSHRLAKKAGIMNAYVRPVLPWLASALRCQAEKTADRRKALLKRAWRVARRALKIARRFQNELPHALREYGLIAAVRGSIRRARKYLDESLTVAEQQGARFEYSQSLLARGRVGKQHNWAQAQQDLSTAQESLRSLGGAFVLDHGETGP
jgi:two-component system sensor kinase